MNEENKSWVDETVNKIKELVAKGNISRILVKHGDNTILNIPLNAGVVGTILGLTAAPWAMIAAAIATIGFDGKVELIKTDGETLEIFSREVGKKAVDFNVTFINEIKDTIKKD